MRRRSGFTLIELLIVVVIIGLLTAIAIPRFQNTRGKANYAAMRSDLHNLASAEEGYFFSANGYTTSLDSLNFRGSPGVTITFGEATNAGWSATTTHPASYPHRCSMFIGGATPVPPATTEGVVACE